MTAAWTDVDPNTLLPGDPWTSAKAQAAFENVVALAEGLDLTSPRILGNAAATIREYAAANPFSALSAGDVTLEPDLFDGYTFANTNANSSTEVSAGQCEITSRANGTLRFNATHFTRDSSNPSNIKLYKNSVEIASFSTTETIFTATDRSVDATADIGDVFEWTISQGGSGSFFVEIELISVSANDGLTTVPLYIKQSELR